MKMQKAYNTWTINIKYCVVFLIFTIIACTNHANIKHKGAYIDIEDKEIEVGALKRMQRNTFIKYQYSIQAILPWKLQKYYLVVIVQVQICLKSQYNQVILIKWK